MTYTHTNTPLQNQITKDTHTQISKQTHTGTTNLVVRHTHTRTHTYSPKLLKTHTHSTNINTPNIGGLKTAWGKKFFFASR